MFFRKATDLFYSQQHVTAETLTRLANRCKRRMVSSAAAVATTRSVSDSNLRSCKEEWPACRGRRDNDLPRLILIFVAAKKNGPPAAAVAATIFRI